MSGTGAPAWVAAVLRRLLPGDYADDVLADLAADARRRFGDRRTGGMRVGLWYLAQVASPSMLRLWWRLRRRGRNGNGWEGLMAGDAGGRRGGGGLAADLKHAARGLARSRSFTVAAVLSLGLGIGANAAMFSVVRAVLLRPPPYAEPDRLVFVWNRLAGFDLARLPLALIQIVELRAEEAVFEDAAGIWATNQTLVTDDRAVLASAGLVTPNFFSVLGVEPALGRGFSAESAARGERTVLISDGLWRRELGADPGVVGRAVRLEGGDAVVVGVLPRALKLMFPPAVGVPERLDLYVPYPWTAATPDGSRFLRTVARLRPGVTAATADATAKRVAERLRSTHSHMAEAGDAFTAAALRADTVERIRPVLLALMAGVSIFLLLTAVNVASLLLARSTARRRELAVRACLGASRSRLARLLLAEVALLTALGAALGLLLGGWGVRLLWTLRPAGIARVDDVGLDLAVASFTVLAALVAGVIAGAAPALRLRRGAPMALLRRSGDRGPGAARSRRWVTAIELALSVVLVVGAVLIGQTFARLQAVDPGFDRERVLTFRLGLSLSQFPEDAERARLARRIEEELRALPGVTAAGGGSHIPLADWANWSDAAAPEGTPEVERQRYHFDHRSVTPGYLEALGATLVAGRFFRTDDGPSSQPVVLIDEALARRAFPDGDAIGRRLVATRYVGGAFVPTPAVVVGVIRDLRDHAVGTPSSGQLYWPFAQSARWELTYAVRAAGEPAALTERVRAVLPELSRDLAAADFRTLDDYVAASMAETRFASVLAAIFAALALALAALGLYGVVAYATARRTRELGVRVALGARPRDLFARVVRDGLAVGAIGIGAGLIAAALVTRYLDTLLFEVDPLDPAVFGGVGAALLLVAAAASAGPAIRATRVDPVRSLTAE